MVRAGWEGWWRSLTDFFSTAILRVVSDRGGFEEKIYVQGLGENGEWRMEEIEKHGARGN